MGNNYYNSLSYRGGGLFNKSIIVTSASQLSGEIDSTTEYFLDGIIDMGDVEIIAPVGGINLRGYNANISGLISNADNYTMFKSEGAGVKSGDLLGSNYFISVTGAGSKVYDLHSATGNNLIGTSYVNYVDCTSLGNLYDYYQGLEDGTIRIGGSPTLTFHGLWGGGYRASTSIIRALSSSMTEPVFKAGNSFQMSGRFLTDLNCDLPPLAPLLDFGLVNFPNPSTLQLKGCEITRGGEYDSEDPNLTPNISSWDLPCLWKGNNGVSNTFIGGKVTVTSEVVTQISSSLTWYDVSGVFSGSGLQHYSSTTDGKMTHNGRTPKEFDVTADLSLAGTANDVLAVRFRKWDDSESTFVDLDYTEQVETINSLSGNRNVAFVSIDTAIAIDRGDYIQLQVRNTSGTGNVTLEESSSYRIREVG